MTLLIAGSGKIEDFNLTPYIPIGTRLFLLGGNKRVDKMVEDYGNDHMISRLRICPNYRRYKLKARCERDEDIVRRADKILILWNEKSKRIEHIISYAQQNGKDIQVVLI